jgi:hypothetical protein
MLITADTTFSITLHADGRTTVSGPIQDKALCYALLECAKDAIREAHGSTNSPIIHAPLKVI